MSKSENIQIHKYLTRPSRPTANESVDVRSLMSSNRRNEVTQILLNDINDFRKKNTLYPNQKYIFNINKLQEIVKEKTGKIVDSEFLKEIKENLEQIKKANKTGIAIALNGTVIAKSQWEQTKLSVNDTITIITATQGG